MRHTREEVIQRTMQEFQLLDEAINNLTEEDWQRLLLRGETEDPWTVKDALAHITHWKADVIRAMRGKRRPPEERGLKFHEENHLIYTRWHERTPQEVLAFHRQVQQDVLAALRQAPEAWFSGKERKPDWPFDLDGHSRFHRVKDITRSLVR